MKSRPPSSEQVNFHNVTIEKCEQYLAQLNQENGIKSLHVFLGLSDIQRPNFIKRNLSGKNFSGAILNGVNFYSATMQKATFIDAQMIRARLQWADLSFSNFAGANLNGALLGGAGFIGADLTGVNLNGAKLNGAIFIGVKGRCKAQLEEDAKNGAIVTPEALLKAVQEGAVSYECAYGYTASLSRLASIEQDHGLQQRYKHTASACKKHIQGLSQEKLPLVAKQDNMNKPLLLMLGYKADPKSHLHHENSRMPNEIFWRFTTMLIGECGTWGYWCKTAITRAEGAFKSLRHEFNLFGAGRQWPDNANLLGTVIHAFPEMKPYENYWRQKTVEESNAYSIREKIELLLMARHFDPGSSIYLTSDIGTGVYYYEEEGRSEILPLENGITKISKLLLDVSRTGDYWRKSIAGEKDKGRGINI